LKKKFLTILISIILLGQAPSAFALLMPQSGDDLANMVGIGAKAFAVYDVTNGQMLMSSNLDAPRIPASLTKLVTALVVLDSKTKLTKVVTMTKDDQIIGACSNGGACVNSKAGVKFTVNGLFHALLLRSANNAANALARSTGLSTADFVDRMNKKAAELGATNSHFYEPTGLNPANIITASDYVKILAAAFSSPYLSNIAGLSQFSLLSTNNSRYNQVIKNGDKLLANPDIQVLGAKTGYLDESGYNFSALLKYRDGQKLALVVLGEPHMYSAYAETALLAGLAEDARSLAESSAAGLGVSTPPSNLSN